MRTEVTVVNMSQSQVWRAGYVFGPKQERTITVTETGYAEIKACQALAIYEPGIRCDHPGCGFIAKSEGGLRFHKRIHDKSRHGNRQEE